MDGLRREVLPAHHPARIAGPIAILASALGLAVALTAMTMVSHGHHTRCHHRVGRHRAPMAAPPAIHGALPCRDRVYRVRTDGIVDARYEPCASRPGPP
jgi:hypothetical protein